MCRASQHVVMFIDQFISRQPLQYILSKMKAQSNDSANEILTLCACIVVKKSDLKKRIYI